MKKVRRIGAVLICAAMMISLFGCDSSNSGKSKRSDDDDDEEITVEIEDETTEETEETTTEETTAFTSPAPTATPIPKPDPMSKDGSQYEIFMHKIDMIEEENPGSTYEIGHSWGSDEYWVLSVMSGDEYNEYVIANGQLIDNMDLLNSPMYFEGYSYSNIRDIPFLFDVLDEPLKSFYTGELLKDEVVDGTFDGTLVGVSEDLKYAYVMYGKVITFEDSYVKSLEVGDVVDIPYPAEVKVETVNDDFVGLDNYMVISKGNYLNTYDEDTWYLAENDFACTNYEYLAIIEIADDCKVIEAENNNNDSTAEAVAQYNGDGFADSYIASKLPEDYAGLTSRDNNGWYAAYMKPGSLTQFKISDGKITEMHIEYPWGI